jgi:hypothetical protein
MFDPTEKNLLLGAFATAGVDVGLEGYYGYTVASGKELKGQFPFIEFHPAIPPLDDWIACAVFPALLYTLGKGMKKNSLVQMAKGGAIYGVSELIGQTVYRVAGQIQPTAARYIVVRR